jgi:YD repeat-containing protein
VTNYAYNAAGEVTNIGYVGSVTPAVTIAYNRIGKPSGVTDGSGTRALTYAADGQLASEFSTGGTGVSIGYDGYLRRSSLQVKSSNTVFMIQNYGYDAATGNFSSTDDGVGSGGISVAYGYASNSRWLSSTTF